DELITKRTESEIVAGEVIIGGAGTDTLYVFGTADLSGVSIDATVENLGLFSTVYLTPTQLSQLKSITLFGNTPHSIVIVKEDANGNPIVDEQTGKPEPETNQRQIFEKWLAQEEQQLFFENDGQPGREKLALTVGTLNLDGAQEIADYLFNSGSPFTNELESELDELGDDVSLPRPKAPTADDVSLPRPKAPTADAVAADG